MGVLLAILTVVGIADKLGAGGNLMPAGLRIAFGVVLLAALIALVVMNGLPKKNEKN